jgi:predicted nucleic acid-binding protein
MTTAFMLDTSVISETNLPYPRESIVDFLDTADVLYLPAGAMVELLMGITLICATNPVQAVKLSNWYHKLIKSGMPIIETDREVIDMWGILIADKRLKNLWADRVDKFGQHVGKSRGGQDVHIAAAALAKRLPIATLNVKDFMRIDEFYPLPGIYNPETGVWHTKMEPLADRYPIANYGRPVSVNRRG